MGRLAYLSFAHKRGFEGNISSSAILSGTIMEHPFSVARRLRRQQPSATAFRNIPSPITSHSISFPITAPRPSRPTTSHSISPCPGPTYLCNVASAASSDYPKASSICANSSKAADASGPDPLCTMCSNVYVTWFSASSRATQGARFTVALRWRHVRTHAATCAGSGGVLVVAQSRDRRLWNAVRLRGVSTGGPPGVVESSNLQLGLRSAGVTGWLVGLLWP